MWLRSVEITVWFVYITNFQIHAGTKPGVLSICISIKWMEMKKSEDAMDRLQTFLETQCSVFYLVYFNRCPHIKSINWLTCPATFDAAKLIASKHGVSMLHQQSTRGPIRAHQDRAVCHFPSRRDICVALGLLSPTKSICQERLTLTQSKRRRRGQERV